MQVHMYSMKNPAYSAYIMFKFKGHSPYITLL